MNDRPYQDQQLQAFEARLAMLSPKLSDDDRSELLYQCAFAAGQRSSARRVHTWQLTTAALLLVLLGASVPLVSPPFQVARHAERPPPLEPQAPAREAVPAEISDRDLFPRPAVEVALDAWQLPDTSGDKLSHELARFEEQEEAFRSLAMGVLRARELP